MRLPLLLFHNPKEAYMTGKIIKGIAGFYYVHSKDGYLYECKAKGIFRNRNVKPLVGDDVEISVLDETERKGNIEEILPRKNALVRPAAANVDQALADFSFRDGIFYTADLLSYMHTPKELTV